MKTGGLTIRSQKVPLQQEPIPFRPPKILLDKRKERSERIEATNQHLGCLCNSGSPVLSRGLEGKVWVGYCRKCKPSPSTPSNYDYGFDASPYGEVR